MEQVDLVEVDGEGILEEGDNNAGVPEEGGIDAGVPEEGGENPIGNGYSRIIRAAVVGGVVGYVAFPLVVTAGLYYFGFTATGMDEANRFHILILIAFLGIAASSFAAASQAAVGNVAAGGWIATCTSLGMTGAAATATTGAAAGAAAGALLTKRKDDDNQV